MVVAPPWKKASALTVRFTDEQRTLDNVAVME